MRTSLAILVLVVAATVCAETPQIGNGFLATFVNSSVEYISGVYNKKGVDSTRAGLPATTQYTLSCGYKPQGELILNTTAATVIARGTCSNGAVQVKHTWYAHRARRGTIVLDVVMWNLGASAVSVDLKPVPVEWKAFKHIVFVNTTIKSGINITVYATREKERPEDPVTYVAVAKPDRDYHVTIKAGGMETAHILSSRCVSIESQSPELGGVGECAWLMLVEAMMMSDDGLFQHHFKAWTQMWQHRIMIDGGSNALPSVVDASYYAILCSMRWDWPYSTSPGGLTTDGYRGHVFWDMETWMLPTVALFEPEMAITSALRYRANRMAGAGANAKMLGSLGAAFPWESAFTGYDACPWRDGALKELHITADVVIAVELLYDLTNDKDFLKEFFPMLMATCEFWISRGERNNATGQWHLRGVIPPDEYHDGDDSVYTNYAARRSVTFAIRAARELNYTAPRIWDDFASNIVILFDEKNNIHPEFDGYKGDRVKQADVVLLNFPLMMPMKPSVIQSDLDYYAPRTDPNGPAMTWSMFSVGYLSVMKRDIGLAYFTKGYADNALPPYYQWYEVPHGGGCPNFVTGAGGFLQSVWAGLGGMRVEHNALVIHRTAVLVNGSNTLNLNGVRYHGSRIQILYRRDRATQGTVLTLSLQEEGWRKLYANGKLLEVGKGVSFDLSTTDVAIAEPAPATAKYH